MGRIFLLVLACVAGFAIWRISANFSGDESKPERIAEQLEKPREGNSDQSDLSPVVSTNQRSVSSELKTAFEDVVFVVCQSGDWIQVLDWGICRQGDWLPCGRQLRRWSDRLAVVWNGQIEMVVRFARPQEFPEPDRLDLPAVESPILQSKAGESSGGAESGLGAAVGAIFGGQ